MRSPTTSQLPIFVFVLYVCRVLNVQCAECCNCNVQCAELLAVACILHTAILQIPNEKNKSKCKYGAYVYVMCINLCGYGLDLDLLYIVGLSWIWIWIWICDYVICDMLYM